MIEFKPFGAPFRPPPHFASPLCFFMICVLWCQNYLLQICTQVQLTDTSFASSQPFQLLSSKRRFSETSFRFLSPFQLHKTNQTSFSSFQKGTQPGYRGCTFLHLPTRLKPGHDSRRNQPTFSTSAALIYPLPLQLLPS